MFGLLIKHEARHFLKVFKVDYLEGHQGRTNLQLLEGLSLFIDDIYACGYLDQTEIVRIRGKVSCEPVSRQIVARISMAAQGVLGGPRKTQGSRAQCLQVPKAPKSWK